MIEETGTGDAREPKELSRKEGINLVNKLFPIKRKRGELANENTPKLQERVGYIGNLSGYGLDDIYGYLTDESVSQGVTGKRNGHFLIDEKTGDAYQLSLIHI